MTLFRFISTHHPADRVAIASASTLAGIANVIALGIATSAVAQPPGTASGLSFAAFGLFVAIRIFASRYSAHRTVELMERTIHDLKTRLVDKIARAKLQHIERLGSSEIFDRITQNMTTLSGSASIIGALVQALFIFAFSLIYLFHVSTAGFVILVPLMVGALQLFRTRSASVGPFIRQYSTARVEFLDRLLDLLAGSKEIKMNRARARAVQTDFERSSRTLRDVSTAFTRVFFDNNLLLSSHLFVFVGAVVFILPNYVDFQETTLSQIVAVVVFSWSSLLVGINGYPMYVQSNAALADIAALEKKLDDAADVVVTTDPWQGKAAKIELKGATYEYLAAEGDKPFCIGPIDLSVEPGEILFVVGGNGAGKSTLLKVLTGLYAPTAGVVQMGDHVVDVHSVAAYREMFSVIFSDFHLFSKVYGLQNVDPQLMQALLHQMQIDHKTGYADGRFTQLNLSTGQKKRLAMIVALLDDRPLMVVDEWAADQDPEFRKYFYDELLPMLKRKGKTILAVSHDDRYFRCADRVVTMEYGTIRTIRNNRLE